MFNYDVKFLTSDDSIDIKNNDFKSFKYVSPCKPTFKLLFFFFYLNHYKFYTDMRVKRSLMKQYMIKGKEVTASDVEAIGDRRGFDNYDNWSQNFVTEI